MNIDTLTSLVTLLLALSLATERLVTIIKTLFPGTLADEKKTEAQEIDLVSDKWRRFAVQIISFVCAWFTASFLAKDGFNPVGCVSIGDEEANHCFPIWALGMLSTGGSAFWNNILGYTKAVKDIRVQRRAKEGLEYHQQAEEVGVIAYDGGVAARSRRLGVNAPQMQAVMSTISQQSQPAFDSSTNRLVTTSNV